MQTIIKHKTIIATLTNIAYVVAGFALFRYDSTLLVPFVYACILAACSGIHHAIGSDFTRDLDYAGMYGVITALIFYGVGWSGVIGAALTGLVTLLLVIFFGSRPVIIGIGIFVLIILVGLSDVGNALIASGIIYTAYVFNHIGDNLHRGDHDLIHGAWHVVTAIAIYQAGIWL